MRLDFFEILPSEIISNILIRLSVRSIAVSKCVCKPWLHLLETDDFIKSHFSKSIPALAFTMQTSGSNRLIVSELEEDELDPERRYDPLMKLDFPHEAYIRGSSNGLLFLFKHSDQFFYVCNPITREFCSFTRRGKYFYGFGASRVTGQHKVVCFDPCFGRTVQFKGYVYTLGTGSWRCIEAMYPFGLSYGCLLGTFLNGNLHWRITSSAPDIQELVSCFDLETECFSTFSVPPLRRGRSSGRLYTLRNSLSFCDDESLEDGGVVIWMMKEYGIEKSWTKEYVISRNHLGRIRYSEDLSPIKVFKNGDILILFSHKMFMYYSKKTNTSQEIGRFFDAAEVEDFEYLIPMLLTPSLVSLKTICGVENVISF